MVFLNLEEKKEKKKATAPRRSSLAKERREKQQLQLRQVLVQVEDIRREIREDREERRKLRLLLEELQEKVILLDKRADIARHELGRIRTLPGDIDSALDWVVNGLMTVQEHLRDARDN